MKIDIRYSYHPDNSEELKYAAHGEWFDDEKRGRISGKTAWGSNVTIAHDRLIEAIGKLFRDQAEARRVSELRGTIYISPENFASRLPVQGNK